MLPVVIKNTRIGMALLLALLVPAALTAAWAWLVHGGVIENAEASERASAQRCEDGAVQLLNDALKQAAAASGIKLVIDANRHCIAPFAGGPDLTVPADLDIAEQAARIHLANNDAAGALPFYANAFERGTLSAEGVLTYADQVRPDDEAKASEVLQAAEEQHAEVWCGPLPFSLLLALHRVRAGIDVAVNTLVVLQQTLRIEPATVPAIVAELVTAVPAMRDDARVLELEPAALIRSAFRESATPDRITMLDTGAVVVPLSETELAAVPKATTDTWIADAVAQTAIAQPDFELGILDLTNASWQVRRVTMATSTLLGYVANTCLGLAIATLVLGNLLLWRLSRRELALVRMRRDFVDVVSHELRTPLTALSLKAEMLANGDVPDARQQHYLQTLHGDVTRLSDQVERILDFGRMERGAPLQREVVATRSVLARGLRAGLPALRLVQQNVALEVPRTLPPVEADVSVLTRALRNLLENAAKYAPAGSTVAVRAFADGDKITVEVADTGPGVAPDERQAIFQPFVRASTATPGIQGSGLGLALVAAAAKAHGGSVEVRDRNGGGAVFTLQLPTAKENAS